MSATCWPSSTCPIVRRRRSWPSARGWPSAAAGSARPRGRGGPANPRGRVLGPITAGNRDRVRPTLTGMPLAIITGASRGLGLALARSLARDGWALVIDARGAADLERVAGELASLTEVAAVAGDVADPAHRHALVAAAGERVDLLVNNASVLGPSPQPSLERYPLD